MRFFFSVSILYFFFSSQILFAADAQITSLFKVEPTKGTCVWDARETGFDEVKKHVYQINWVIPNSLPDGFKVHCSMGIHTPAQQNQLIITNNHNKVIAKPACDMMHPVSITEDVQKVYADTSNPVYTRFTSVYAVDCRLFDGSSIPTSSEIDSAKKSILSDCGYFTSSEKCTRAKEIISRSEKELAVKCDNVRRTPEQTRLLVKELCKLKNTPVFHVNDAVTQDDGKEKSPVVFKPNPAAETKVKVIETVPSNAKDPTPSPKDDPKVSDDVSCSDGKIKNESGYCVDKSSVRTPQNTPPQVAKEVVPPKRQEQIPPKRSESQAHGSSTDGTRTYPQAPFQPTGQQMSDLANQHNGQNESGSQGIFDQIQKQVMSLLKRAQDSQPNNVNTTQQPSSITEESQEELCTISISHADENEEYRVGVPFTIIWDLDEKYASAGKVRVVYSIPAQVRTRRGENSASVIPRREGELLIGIVQNNSSRKKMCEPLRIHIRK